MDGKIYSWPFLGHSPRTVDNVGQPCGVVSSVSFGAWGIPSTDESRNGKNPETTWSFCNLVFFKGGQVSELSQL